MTDESTVGTCRDCSEELAIQEPSDRAPVIEHYVENHPDSETLTDALEVMQTRTDCSGCGTEFVAVPSVGMDAGESPALFLPAFCDECAAADALDSLLVEETTAGEVFAHEA